MENPRSEIGGDSRIGPMVPPLGCIHTGYQYCTRGPAVPNSRRRELTKYCHPACHILSQSNSAAHPQYWIPILVSRESDMSH